ncbi:PREDICTED: uncharacterized protein LOC106786840 [Polistes canadensis]|uniref:uncharacterized protein LOC106786840 n=1 Tax=Polistes canadensis TaxID=91411 RepID=UPI000718C3D6|nr:PREDICTED: uncharacterized protein LOC106786840 [Polistes canadensis]
MCDLIDLDNSAGSSLNTKLASPLIPVPSNIERKNINICDNRLNNNALIAGKRESFGDNPFDAILDEAIENVRKKEDPFETVYEEALMRNDITAQEEKNINITDDLKATYTQLCKLKENKTSDEFLPNPDIVVSTAEINSLDLSILNHSAMNDTLYESKYNEEGTEIPCMPQHKILLNTKTIQTRSYSQGDIKSECKQLLKPRSNSTTETLKIDKININDSDSKSFSVFNKGFIEDQNNDTSVFSTISNISSITRNSGSLTHTSASMPNNTMNMAFLNNCSSSVAYDERINNTISTVSTISLPITLAQKSIQTTVDVNNKLPDDKLLDIDICIPEITYSKLSNNTCLNSSSDSIFLKQNNINTSIINEAKALARTFEEFAGKSSGSNVNELIMDDPMWISELLPAYEDDVVDNLIEVPVLNATNREQENGDMLSCNSNTNDITKSQNNVKKEMDIAPLNQITVNKTAASTLLVDLKKIVKIENNSEANRLLEDLEQVLGIQSSNKIELFSTCIQTTNDSRAIQNTKEEKHVDKSHVDDLKNYEIEVKKSHYDNKINGCEAFHDNNKSLIKENEVSSINPRIEIFPKEESYIDIEKKEINVDINNFTQKNMTINKEENNRTESNEKVAVELLINLGKVLSGQSNESATLNLLKNLGEVLNLVSKNDQEKNNEQSNVISNNTEKISIKDKSENKVKSSTPLKVKQRRSFDLMSKAKPTYQKVLRRSTCTSSTSPPKKLQKSFVFKENNKSQLTKARKRFPSDPGSINLNSSKTEIAASIGDHPIISIDKVNTNKNNSKEKPSIKLVVKNQLKHKSKSEIVNKKGPMKAIIPIGNMQRKGTTTPPKSPKNIQPCIKIFSSTPNSIESSIELKKSPKLKPMASSTPDFPKCKSTVQVPTLQRRDRLNVSCDISPINVQEEVTTEKCKVYLSPRRANKSTSPRKRTPKSKKRESSIPKYSMSPGVHVRASSQDINKSQEISMSSQNLSRKEEIFKKSPMIRKKIDKSERKSPLTDNNINIAKGKPFNLNSKFRGNSNENIESEKENTFV